MKVLHEVTFNSSNFYSYFFYHSFCIIRLWFLRSQYPLFFFVLFLRLKFSLANFWIKGLKVFGTVEKTFHPYELCSRWVNKFYTLFIFCIVLFCIFFHSFDLMEKFEARNIFTDSKTYIFRIVYVLVDLLIGKLVEFSTFTTCFSCH